MSTFDEDVDAALRELLGPKDDEQRHRRIVDLISRNVRLQAQLEELQGEVAQMKKGDYETKREEVPGKVIRVTWWNGVQSCVTYEAQPHAEPEH